MLFINVSLITLLIFKIEFLIEQAKKSVPRYKYVDNKYFNIFLFLLKCQAPKVLQFSLTSYRYFTDKVLFQLRQSYYGLMLKFVYAGNRWGVSLIVKSKENRSASWKSLHPGLSIVTVVSGMVFIL